jgi:hypothetical protein
MPGEVIMRWDLSNAFSSYAIIHTKAVFPRVFTQVSFASHVITTTYSTNQTQLLLNSKCGHFIEHVSYFLTGS